MQLIGLLAVLIMTAFCGMAQDPVKPPFLFPQERWEMSFDNYYGLMGDDDYANMTREVSIVRDGADLYIEGIFAEYPDAWTKCAIVDGQLCFEAGQVLDIVNQEPIYFQWGSAEFLRSDGNTFWSNEITFRTVSGTYAPTFRVSDDGSTMTSYPSETGAHGAFWYDVNPNGILRFDYGYNRSEGVVTGSGFPEMDFPVKMVLRRIDSGAEN